MHDSNHSPRQALPGQFDSVSMAPGYVNNPPARQSIVMRRRVIVFFSVFLVSALVSLSYTFMRPAIYLASARVQITPAARLPLADAAAAPDSAQALLLELQVLNSRPLLETVVARLVDRGELKDVATDRVLLVQDMLKVTRVEASNVVQIEAQGPQRSLVARLVNAVIEVYREQLALAGKSAAQTELSEAHEEARVVEARVAAKKQEIEAFRLRSNIVSPERDENHALSRLKALGASLDAASDREAVAAGKLHALEQAFNAGQRAPQTRDSAAITGLGQRLSLVREEWRALERQFTQQFLEMDPNARALRTRIANLEQQLEGERHASQQSALAAAREDLASARATMQRLQQRLADEKRPAQSFTRRFGDFQTMQEEMRGLEQMRQTARKRVLGLEASERARKPRLSVLEAAVVPESPWKPLYWRDAAISMAASVLLGFLAVWFFEFFNRPEPTPPGPSTVILTQPWLSVPHTAAMQLGGAAAPTALLAGATQGSLLPAPQARELSHDELSRLLANAAPEHVALVACLLSGLSAAVLVGLRVAHVDADARTLTVAGEPGRVLALEGPLRDLPARCVGRSGEMALFANARGEPLSIEDLDTVVTSSAYDANLADAQSITPETLRHTYVAFLVRQGLRFSELGKLVGGLPSEALNALAPLVSGSARIGLDAVECMLPALREFGQG